MKLDKLFLKKYFNSKDVIGWKLCLLSSKVVSRWILHFLSFISVRCKFVSILNLSPSVNIKSNPLFAWGFFKYSLCVVFPNVTSKRNASSLTAAFTFVFKISFTFRSS